MVVFAVATPALEEEVPFTCPPEPVRVGVGAVVVVFGAATSTGEEVASTCPLVAPAVELGPLVMVLDVPTPALIEEVAFG